jgi:mono/diheme cytochrome c family protein
MSHFLTLVLVDVPGLRPEELRRRPRIVREQLDRLLAPYDENTAVAPYEDRCPCVGLEAERAGRAHADQTVGTYDAQRRLFHAEVAPTLLPEPGEAAVTQRQLEAAWQAFTAEFRAAYKTAEHASARAHPLFERPSPDCADCHGAGVRTTTYNPKSKWDWWVVGGRWHGIVRHGVFREGGDQESLSDNAAPVSELKENIPEYIHAVVTPDGAWHEQGWMGWWGMVRDEKPEDAWRREVAALLLEHRRALAVGCDLHI